jgi:hypothetical protein
MLPVSKGERRKPLVWLHGCVKTPPFTRQGRVEAGVLLGVVNEIIRHCRQRLTQYDAATRNAGKR